MEAEIEDVASSSTAGCVAAGSTDQANERATLRPAKRTPYPMLVGALYCRLANKLFLGGLSWQTTEGRLVHEAPLVSLESGDHRPVCVLPQIRFVNTFLRMERY